MKVLMNINPELTVNNCCALYIGFFVHLMDKLFIDNVKKNVIIIIR